MDNQKNEKLFIYVFKEIQRFIVENRLKPSDMLPTELEISERLGVSRNVVRESVKAMELMGMVKSTAGKGCVIQEFSTDMLFDMLFFHMGIADAKSHKDILVLRKKLELSYMDEAFHAMQVADIAEMRGVLNQCIYHWERNRFFHADDMQFHMALFKPLNNRILNSLLEAVWKIDELLHMEIDLNYKYSRIEKHEQIMIAIEERDYEKFVTGMQKHFSTDKYDGI